ncbi:10347_t:CDS:2, partial [Gigaspora rosea]
NGIEPDLNKKVYVPLISGYTIYTYYGVYLKISLEWNEAQQMIFYKWIDYRSDWKFITEQKSHFSNNLNSLRNHLQSASIKYKAKRKARKLDNSKDIQAVLQIKAEGWNTSINGLAIKLIIKCLNSTEYSNESPEMDFSTSVAAAGLVGGVNREEWRSILALVGITRQSGKSQYFAKQDQLFDSLKNEAVNSAQKALYKVLDKLIENK